MGLLVVALLHPVGLEPVSASPYKIKRQPVPRATTAVVLPNALVQPPEQPRTNTTITAAPPPSLPTDCSRDVSDGLNTWLDALPASGVRAVLPVNACYRTDRAVTLRGKSNWILDGRGARLLRTQPTPAELRYPNNNRHLAVVASTDVVVRGLNITGLNIVSDVPKFPEYGTYVRDLEFEHAFSAWNSSRLLFVDLTSDASFGDGLYLHSDVSDVTVRTVDIARNGRQGIGVLASRVLIDGAVVRSSRRSGVDLEPDNTPMGDVEIRNSTISSHLLAFASAGAGDVDRIHIHHNTVNKSGVPFLYASRQGFTRNDWTVADNWVTTGLGSPAAAVRFSNASRTVVNGNVIPVATTQSRKIFDVASGSSVTADCNAFPGALDDLVTDRDGTSRVTVTRATTGLVPPPCLDTSTVGAPRTPEPWRSSNDWFSGATVVPSLPAGAASATYAVDNEEFGTEQFEGGTYGTTGRSAWFRYRTGATAEIITVHTTSRLRSVKVITGDSLFWQVPIAEHYDTGSLTAHLAANTTYSINVDDSTYSSLPITQRTVRLSRA